MGVRIHGEPILLLFVCIRIYVHAYPQNIHFIPQRSINTQTLHTHKETCKRMRKRMHNTVFVYIRKHAHAYPQNIHFIAHTVPTHTHIFMPISLFAKSSFRIPARSRLTRAHIQNQT